MEHYEAVLYAVQQGDRERLPELWETVERFAARQARRRLTAYREINTDYAVDVEDLIQEGFIAMLQAVETYRGGGRMSFLGWWEMYLKTAYNKALGTRCERVLHDPIHQCTSLSTPLNDENGGTLAEVIPDNQNPIEAAEAAIWWEELGQTMTAALETLPEDWKSLLTGRYIHEKTFQELAAEAGSSHQSVRDKTARALKRIRKNDTAGCLAEFAAQL